LEHVHPDTGALAVLEAGQPPEVLARDGSQIRTEAGSEIALGSVPLVFIQREAAAQPDVTAAGRGGVDEKGAVLAGYSGCRGAGHVIEEHERPSIAAGRADVDVGVADVVRPGPGQGERGERPISVPQHGAIRAPDGEVGSVNAGA